MFGIDGVLLALIITFIILFGAILSGFPVAFAIGGAGVLSFVRGRASRFCRVADTYARRCVIARI